MSAGLHLRNLCFILMYCENDRVSRKRADARIEVKVYEIVYIFTSLFLANDTTNETVEEWKPS